MIQLKTALGPVPNRWAVAPLRHCVELRNDRTRNDSDLGPPIGLEHVESWTGRLASRPDDDETEGQHSLFRRGDVLFGKLRPYLAKAHRAQDDGACSAELLVLRPRTIDAGYLTYCLLSPTWVSLIDSSTFGSKMPRANWEFIGHQVLPIPSVHEQRAIADFLDRETERIDALVAKKQRLIELLQEKRTALISHAVTKGLDPDVPMKDSGIEWLGRIPAAWDVRRLKQLTEFVTSGSRGWAEFYSDEGPIFIRITNLDRKSVDLDPSHVQSVNPPPGTEGERTKVRPGDVLVSITADIGTIGVVPDGLGEAYVNQHTALVRPRASSVEPRCLALALHSSVGQRQFSALLQGGTKVGVNLDDVRNLVVPVPPLVDQRRLICHIDDAAESLARLSAEVRKAISRLREYRSALITAAVTGQVDVRATL